VAEAPPPLPVRPAGFGWRTLAFLLDLLPLTFLAQHLAGVTAGDEARQGRADLETWVDTVVKAYAEGIAGAGLDPVRVALQAAPATGGDWVVHAGFVGALTFALALGLQEAALGGRTLGKAVVSLRVIDVRTGQPPAVAGCLLRGAWKGMFLCLPSLLVNLVGLIGFHLPLFRKDGRALHDLATFTQVIDGRGER
jgi:uncharacterized RDD family membrane protein YckC